MYLGFSSSKTLTVSNTSHVPLNYHAYVPNDGTAPPICFDQLVSFEKQSDDHPASNDQLVSDDQPVYGDQPVSDEPDVEAVGEEEPRALETADTKPKEFTVDPSSGVLEPESDVTFTVNLCPNSMSQYFSELAVSFDEVANQTYTIPITAQYANGIYFML